MQDTSHASRPARPPGGAWFLDWLTALDAGDRTSHRFATTGERLAGTGATSDAARTGDGSRRPEDGR